MKVRVQEISPLSLLAVPCTGAENLSLSLTKVVHLAMEKGVMEDPVSYTHLTLPTTPYV